jgi:hypothetical protein
MPYAAGCLASAPLLAGTDIVHASPETLAILTSPELLEVNQDLGISGNLQARLLTPATPTDTIFNSAGGPAASDYAGDNAVAVKCDGGADQQWEFVNPATGAVIGGIDQAMPPYEKPV